MTLGNVAASSISELTSVTPVPPAGAAAVRVTVHVAESPLPPAIAEGLHVNEVGVCAEALEESSAHTTKPIPNAHHDRADALVNTRRLLSNVRLGGPQGAGAGSANLRPSRTDGNLAVTKAVLGTE